MAKAKSEQPITLKTNKKIISSTNSAPRVGQDSTNVNITSLIRFAFFASRMTRPTRKTLNTVVNVPAPENMLTDVNIKTT